MLKPEPKGLEPEGEPLDDLLVLVVHDVDHVPLQLHQHLLSPENVNCGLKSFLPPSDVNMIKVSDTYLALKMSRNCLTKAIFEC